MESCAALSAVCKLITEDLIPAVIGDVMKLLSHEMEIVRKKAVSTLHRLYQLDKTCLTGHGDKIRKSLCDKDPSVMAATLPVILALVQDNISEYKDLVPSLVSILKQITEHRLPKDYDYHRIPAPWIQMNLLRILALLGRSDQASSEGMYEVLVDVMKRADTGITVGYAIVYETVKTIMTIYPNPILIESAATAISRFIRSETHNLKYIGIKGLAAIVKDHPRFAADHQLAVIDCLEDPDETLKRKTLDLLFRMTNSVNVEFIVEKLLQFLGVTTDDHFRTDLVSQITQCAERYAPSNAWYVQTIVRVFELAGDKVKMSVAQTLLQLIAEGANEEDNEQDEAEEYTPDDLLRMDAVEDFLELINNSSQGSKLSEILSQTIAWVLGEYGYLSESHSKEQIMEKLCELAKNTTNSSTRSQIVTALMKLVAQNGSCPHKVTKFINLYADSMSLDLQQRCLEFKALLLHTDTLVDVLPVDASCEDIDIDENLSFLQGFVDRALANGAAPYSPPANDDDDDASNKSSALKLTPYERPTAPPVVTNSSLGLPTPSGSSSTGSVGIPTAIPSTTQGNQLLSSRGAAAVWGRKPVVEAPPPPPVPTSSVTNANTTSVETTTSSVSTVAPTSTPAAPIPEVPKQLSQKELMAQALFGGVAASSGNNAATRAAARAARRSNASVQTPAPAPTPTSVVTQAAPTPTPAPMPTSSNDLFDLLDVGSSPSPSPAEVFSAPIPELQPQIPLSPQKANISDIFGEMNLLDSAPLGITPTASVSSGASIALSTGARPLNINTGEFGQKWMSINMELKQTVSTRVRSLEQLRFAVPQFYGHVESIPQSQEAIFAATSATGQDVLIHFKVNAQSSTCDVLVKSAMKDTCSRELGAICNAISSFQG